MYEKKRPNRYSAKYYELIEDFIQGVHFKEIAKKNGVALITVYDWFKNDEIKEDYVLAIKQKQEINLSIYHKKEKDILNKRLEMLDDPKTDSKTKRDLINDIREETGARGKQQAQVLINNNINPFDSLYEKLQGKHNKDDSFDDGEDRPDEAPGISKKRSGKDN